jgi:hypothetical protein
MFIYLLMVCLTMLSVAQSIQHQIIRRSMNDELIRMLKEDIMA